MALKHFYNTATLNTEKKKVKNKGMTVIVMKTSTKLQGSTPTGDKKASKNRFDGGTHGQTKW